MKGLIVAMILVALSFAAFGMFASNTIKSVKAANEQGKDSVAKCVALGHNETDCLIQSLDRNTIYLEDK